MLLQDKLKGKKIILGSKSPRRQSLLKQLGLEFEVKSKSLEEVYPENIEKEEIAIHLAELKAKAFDKELIDKNTILITADTIVWMDGKVLGKPTDRIDAIKTLKKLSGRAHEVITGVCLISSKKKKTFYVNTKVFFSDLSEEEICYYIDTYKPYDKAGAYGIQEWIGYIGIDRIEGSFYNVVGLPVKALYDELMVFST
ncbi:Maf family nucleotide pyrophosphatase [Bacteroidota bacterium]